MNLPARSVVPDEFRPEQKEAPPTEAQISYLRTLIAEREISDEAKDETLRRLDAGLITKRSISRYIERARELPRRSRGDIVGRTRFGDPPTPEEVPAGRYAVPNEDKVLRFYRLWRGTKNPGYIKLYVIHGDESTELKYGTAIPILRKIAKIGAAECAVLYGREIGCCSRCGRGLTQRISRYLGIGPVCGGHFYADEWADKLAEAREELIAQGLDPDEDVNGEGE